MNVRNGIRIESTRKKPKRRNAPDLRLNTTTMIHNKKGALRLPDFEPVLKLMRGNGWK